MQILYQLELHAKETQDNPYEFKECTEAAFSNTNYIEETKEFSIELAQNVWDARSTIDPIINDKLRGWKIDRISIVDKSILRICIYEILNSPQLPRSVVIDEAIELAKKYSDPESAKYINGILGNLDE